MSLLPSASMAGPSTRHRGDKILPADVVPWVLCEAVFFTLGMLGARNGLFGRLDEDMYWLFKGARAVNLLAALTALAFSQRRAARTGATTGDVLAAFFMALAGGCAAWSVVVAAAARALDAGMLGYGWAGASVYMGCIALVFAVVLALMMLPLVPITWWLSSRDGQALQTHHAWLCAGAAACIHAVLAWWLLG